MSGMDGAGKKFGKRKKKYGCPMGGGGFPPKGRKKKNGNNLRRKKKG